MAIICFVYLSINSVGPTNHNTILQHVYIELSSCLLRFGCWLNILNYYYLGKTATAQTIQLNYFTMTMCTLEVIFHSNIILKHPVHPLPFTFRLSPLETISTSSWASLYHHLPVLSVFSHFSCHCVSSYLVISSQLLSVHLSLGRPLLLLAGTTMPIIFLDTLSSSLPLPCPYQCNRFCLRNVDIWHTLASSCIIWFLTWSFLVLPSIVASSFHMQSVLVFLSTRPT